MNFPPEIGYFFAIFVGITMGILGSGGSILSVPILVYIMGVNPVFATGYSLFIVGNTALVGGIKKIKNKEFDFKIAILFGIPSIISVFFTRKWIVPNIPNIILETTSFIITKSIFLMIVFAIVMLFASIKMIRSNTEIKNTNINEKSNFKLILAGILIGILAGLVGAGGGFMIIPALVLLMNLDMKKAIGTSLIIIASQSLLGFIGELTNNNSVDWFLVLMFTFCSIIGIFIGNKISRNIRPEELKSSFGWFVFVMGIYILIKEIFFK